MEEDYKLKLIIEAQDKFSAELKSMQWQIEQLQVGVKQTQSKTSSALSSIKKWIAALWIWALITKTTKSIINLADNLEKSEIAFTTMLWSAERAEAMLKDLSDFAKKTPFELTWIRESAQQLIAMGVNADDIIPTLKSLWDVSAWLSVPLERLALNYGQVIAQWKLTWRELRDFTMAWVPLLDQLAKQVWTTTTEIQNMISKGQISSNDVIEAFRQMSSEWWKFANLMDKQATTLSWMWSNLQDELNSLWEEIWKSFLPIIKWYIEQISKRVSENSESIKIMAKQIFETVWIVADNIITVLQDVGQTCLELFFWIKSDWSNSAITFWQIFMAVLQKIWQWIEAASKMVSDLWTLMKTWYGRAWNWLKWIKTGWDAFANDFFVYGKSWTESYWNAMRAFWTMDTNWLDEVPNILKDITDWREEFGAKVITQENELFTSFAKTESYFSNTRSALKDLGDTAQNLNLSDILDDSGGWSWSGGKSKTEKMTEEMKDLIKEMEEYAKESEQMRKATYEWIIDWMEEAVKKAEDLANEIDNLHQKIDDLNKEENVDIAKAYIEAEQVIKDYKKEYEWVVELAERYSKIELQDKSKDWSAMWFSAEDLLAVKNAYEGMQSAFEWLNKDQTQALKDQIEAQKEYNDLNDIEKIKADYAEKRKIIQEELDEKMTALQTEINKYNELSTKKQEYEKKWLDYMHYSYKEQQTMVANLIDMYNRLAAAKERAGASGDVGHKAGWWDVYGWTPYIVWEHGPELFIPNQSWSIVPNNQITNNNWIEVNISGVSVRNDSDIEAIAQEMIRQIKLEKQFNIS